jgi:hypothetical protein
MNCEAANTRGFRSPGYAGLAAQPGLCAVDSPEPEELDELLSPDRRTARMERADH